MFSRVLKKSKSVILLNYIKNRSISKLHLANDFAGSKVYKNLISELNQLQQSQVIYTPLRNAGSVNEIKDNYQK